MHLSFNYLFGIRQKKIKKMLKKMSTNETFFILYN